MTRPCRAAATAKEIADILPTNPALRDKMFSKSDAWWAANPDKTSQRFKEWQLAG
jgi:hypothetical protein